MPSLAEATLSEAERRVLDRFIATLARHVELQSVWLFGSRARGEQPGDEDSDVDLAVVTRAGGADSLRVHQLLEEAATAVGLSPAHFMAQVLDREWIDERREVGAFFMREVDTDKIVLYGDEDRPEPHLKVHDLPRSSDTLLSIRSAEYLARARRELRIAKLLVEEGEGTGSVTHSYHAGFEAARGALSEEDLFARSHAGTWGLFYNTFVAAGRFEADLYARAHAAQQPREEVTYRGLVVSSERARELLGDAERFVQGVEGLLGA